jgi:CHAT domain-containing protein/tetratricopeptide (TPR) repeat protein
MSLNTKYAYGGAVETLPQTPRDYAPGRRSLWVRTCVSVVVLSALIPLREINPVDPRAKYAQTRRLFETGYLARSQEQAAAGYKKFAGIAPEIATQFLLLEAESMIWRGLNEDALRLISEHPSAAFPSDELVQKLTLESVALIRQENFSEAAQKLNQSEELCRARTVPACGGMLRAQGILALEEAHFDDAKNLLLQALAFSRQYHDRMLETTTLLNVGTVSLQHERYDEAVDWSKSAYRLAVESGEQDLAQVASGNLGWAYFKLGDRERALQVVLEAERLAARLGDTLAEVRWSSTTGYVYMDSGQIDRAEAAYLRALSLARRINSKADIAGILIDLAQVSAVAGKADQAETYANQALTLAQQSGNRGDQADLLAIQLQAAALHGDRARAEALLQQVEAAPESQTSMKWASEHALAKLYERQGDQSAAFDAYGSALKTVESARAEIQNEDARLPFLSNATRIYDDYIHFLVNEGRTEQALAAADQSRARTLAQGLGVVANGPALVPATLQAEAVAQKRGATILFYWLGDQQSYLWAVTAKQTKLFPLPPQRELTPLIERYRKALLEPSIARNTANDDGAALYRMLVAPAADLIPLNGNVIVICDGPLSLLNFETFVVPRLSSGRRPHYWIEDANLVSAPSLYMLAAAKASMASNQKLLMLGDAVSPNPDYPELPMARGEMERIAKHFAPADETIYQRQAANSGAYLKSPLRDYGYIHFVAHGVASRTDPLDSAIILSSTGANEDSFKLHARDILRRPIDARLVTISACYGGGTRSYAGEGLVGLSWAFLRAGAHNVIGALWEASDDSTPKLMDNLYAGLADGMTPSAALRQAKLELLHSEGKFHEPFYWAPFQIYAGL